MIFQNTTNHYELLEIDWGATPQEIRAAYLKAKSTYHKDSPALYSLMTADEAQNLLVRIEEAYHVLSNPEHRREYDRSNGIQVSGQAFLMATGSDPIGIHARSSTATKETLAQVISIDRVPPMDRAATEADVLVPPKTEFDLPKETETLAAPEAPNTPLEEETEFRGSYIKSVREQRNISIEELSEITKVSRNYLRAIEAEDYSKLPASVYLRGFLNQIAKIFKLPADKLTTRYLNRFNQLRKD
jgi:curved DNA-binding protein CbpA